ncbi:hypothetical protein BpHYR1_041420 [Brachionus plicatilis]|uniref:Uncharacterized protein n=1 Tax=Brachionus plicatilis TaxID=10195 RepID=A0A3M7QYM0_BRAPC|nr:hypothetical protein BpHYR1_041420 [Brachionus plicatilis]
MNTESFTIPSLITGFDWMTNLQLPLCQVGAVAQKGSRKEGERISLSTRIERDILFFVCYTTDTF